MPKSSQQLEQVPEVVAREGWGVDAPPAVWERDWSDTGKAFARLSTAEVDLCLRRLPPATAPRWLESVHQGVAFLHRRGFDLFPEYLSTDGGGTLVRHHGYLYDLSAWAIGDRIELADLGSRQLTNLGEAIARLHRAGTGAPGPLPRVDWLPERIRPTMRLAWDPVARSRDSWQHLDNLSEFFRPLALPSSLTEADEAAAAVVAVANDALTWLEALAAGADLAADRPTLTHGDLWTDHVRFTEDQVTSLVDVDTLALRPPLGDLAALCADFGQWDLERCRPILAGYRSRRPVSSESLASLPRLAGMRVLGIFRDRLRAWLEPARRRESEASLGGPVPYWVDQIRTLIGLDVEAFSRI